MPLVVTITDAGRTALVNADNTGTAPVTIAQFGASPTAIVPDGTEIALPGEVKRIATLSGDVVDDDTIHLIVRDESADAFEMRSFALYLADGTLFAIYGQAAAIISKTAQSVMLLALDVCFANIDAAALTFGDTNFLNPPATTETKGVVELATSAEGLTGADLQRAMTPKAVKDAVTAWLDARFGVNNALIWNPNNDGAGSGMDTDLLRGMTPDQVVSLARVLAALGFTPLQQGGGVEQGSNKVKIGWDGFRLRATVDTTDQGGFIFDSHVTPAAILAKLLTVDGAGSGVDSDTVDGWHRDSIRDWNNLLNKPWSWSGQPGQPQWVWGGNNSNDYRVWDPANFSVAYATGAGNAANADTLDGYHAAAFLLASAFTAAAVKALLLTVDGAGSGVDADLLDGYHGASYDRILSMSIGQDGYIVYASGKKEIWGRVALSANSYSYVTYPITFDTVPAVSFPSIDTATTVSDQNTSLISSNTTGFSVWQAADVGGTLPYLIKGK